MAKLTVKQQRFIEEYLIDLNATQAAIRAGYSTKNADNIASELLGKTQVLSKVSRALAERSRRTGINAERVLQELAKIGFANIADVADLDSASVNDGAGRDDTAAIQSIKVKRTTTDDGVFVEREVKLYDKIKALEQLGRHLGMFNDKLQLEGGVQVVIHEDLEE